VNDQPRRPTSGRPDTSPSYSERPREPTDRATSGRDEARERLIGIGLVVVSALFFGCVDGFSKMLADTQSVAQIVWTRYALALPLLILATRPSGLRALFRTRRPGLQILRGLTPLMISAGMVLGVRYLPLADTTVIFFAAPFLVVALGSPLLGERVGASNWIAVAIGFAAVLVVARPGFRELSHFAVFPLIAAFFAAMLQLITRYLAASGERPATTLAWTLLSGAIAMTPLTIALWEPPDAEAWLLMLALGATFGIAQLLMIRGLAHAPASLLAPLNYAQIISAVLFGLIVFGEFPDLWTLLGIFMLIGSGVYVVRRRRR
jgi:drug/metabolite transporter (DMT)-like permease